MIIKDVPDGIAVQLYDLSPRYLMFVKSACEAGYFEKEPTIFSINIALLKFMQGDIELIPVDIRTYIQNKLSKDLDITNMYILDYIEPSKFIEEHRRQGIYLYDCGLYTLKSNFEFRGVPWELDLPTSLLLKSNYSILGDGEVSYSNANEKRDTIKLMQTHNRLMRVKSVIHASKSNKKKGNIYNG